ncbi:MAG: heavy-metal-associated domain-containing protein [Sphingomonas sp.]
MRNRPFTKTAFLAAAVLLVGTGAFVLAQDDSVVEQNLPDDTSGSYEVSGVQVDVTGKTAEAARYAGWRLAQRKAWQMLATRLGGGAGTVSDGTLDAMVSGIVVENEQIGPNRYIARLGILFSRGRAGALLGVAGQASRSAAMLLIPVEWSGAARLGFEQKTDWQEAWGRFRTGNSSVDYVRPAGTGPDSLLLNAGQVTRPGRTWWRGILDQYGAADVLVPVVKLFRQWPGGPVVGVFQARHGPDDRVLTQFSLRVGNGDAIPVLLDAGVKRIDEAYQAALRDGMLSADPALAQIVPPTPTPTPTDTATTDVATDAAQQSATAGGTAISIQYDSPSVAAVYAAESALRGIPGIKGASTTSLALGGISVMRVTFDADPAVLRAQLEARGWTVSGSGATIRIRRAISAPSAPPADNATGG